MTKQNQPLISVARPSDASLAAEIHARSARIAYKEIFPSNAPAPSLQRLAGEYEAAMAERSSVVLISRWGGVPAGVAALVPATEVPAGWLVSRLYVAPEFWGYGVGSTLHDRILAEAKHIGIDAVNLWVLENNHRGRQFYEHRRWLLVPDSYQLNDPGNIRDVLYRRSL